MSSERERLTPRTLSQDIPLCDYLLSRYYTPRISSWNRKKRKLRVGQRDTRLPTLEGYSIRFSAVVDQVQSRHREEMA